MEYHLYWIGIRESEIEDTFQLFAGSITIFGSGKRGNHAFEREFHLRYNYNQDNEQWNLYVANQARDIIRADPECQFLLYDLEEMEQYGPIVASRAICLNPVSLLRLLSNKFQARQWLSETVPILPYQMLSGANIRYEQLKESFSGETEFVVQSSYSCGGCGTWLLTADTGAQCLKQLGLDSRYAVSPYQKDSVSPNVHLIIYPQAVLVLPPSIQLLEVDERGFAYKGADYPAYLLLDTELQCSVETYARQIGDVLRRAGYRGVCGIDFLISHGNVYFMEINARFQSSTFLLNRAMKEAGWKTSLQALHIQAFQSNKPPALQEMPKVPYSFYHYSYISRHAGSLRCLYKLFRDSREVDCIDDGLDWNMKLEPGTYLFKAVFPRAISAPGPSGECRSHGNICFPKRLFPPKALSRDMERLKLMLLAHGVRMSEIARAALTAEGGFNHEEFEALDLVLNGKICVCAPYATGQSQFSPFCVEKLAEHKFGLSYYGVQIAWVQVRSSDALGETRTKHGIPYHDITYLGNDRLRVYQRFGCFFKEHGVGCQFCDIPEYCPQLLLEDIFEAVDAYQSHPQVRHYLIGGGSYAPEDSFETAIQIARHIRDTTGKPIYLMSLPPKRAETLYVLKASGVTEVAFNLELFDRNLSRHYMPGKGTIPLSDYVRALQTAVELWGKTGAVRTIFVVGLEPAASLLQGIDYVARLGVSPILSLFHPSEEMPLHWFLPPSDEEIWSIYQQAKAICRRYGVELGPSCPYCQDNTMSFPS